LCFDRRLRHNCSPHLLLPVRRDPGSRYRCGDADDPALPVVPAIAKSEKPVDCAEKYSVPSFVESTVVGSASQPFAVWWYSTILPGAMWFSSSQACGTVKLITALLMLVYRAGTRLMYWYTVPGGAVRLLPDPGCTVPVTISSVSFVPVTIALPCLRVTADVHGHGHEREISRPGCRGGDGPGGEAIVISTIVRQGNGDRRVHGWGLRLSR